MSVNLQMDRVWHGGDYNPDQWPESVWDEDVTLMQQAGWNIATLPVFGWASLQSSEETYHFDWLDRVLDKLHAGGIGACMATATASVPAWIAEEHPDVLVTGPHNEVIRHGGRHIFCPNSPNFRRLSTNLVRKIAERYASHPALRIWHISNEYGGNKTGGRCYCPRCAEAFQGWLQKRYGSLENLNHRWDTPFWGKTFTRWTQIEPPFENGERSIQALRLDYDRFQSESLLNCYRAEAAILREITPEIPITTNLMGSFKPLDYHAWAKEMDIVGWDCYPRKDPTFSEVAFTHSLMRGLKEGQPWLLMEQTPSQANWQAQASLKRPGIMRLWSYQAMAHGADSVMYFQWRRTRGGNEKFHGAVVEHAGTSETRVFREVAQVGRELAATGTQTLGGRVPAKVAVLFDWENWWAIEYASGPNQDLKYVPQCQAFYAALHEQGILCDVVSPAADLSQYSVVVAPVLYMVKEGIAAKLEAFVQAGGTFLTTFFSGIADECDSVYLGGYPGPLRKLLGIWVEEVDSLRSDEKNSLFFLEQPGPSLGSLPCGLICERLHLEGAEKLAIFGRDFYAGEPAFTRNSFGNGTAYYLASALESAALKPILRHVCSQAGVEPVFQNLPPGLEVMPRIAPDGTRVTYMLNHSDQQLNMPLPSASPHRDLLTGQVYADQVWLKPTDAVILVEERE